MNVGIIISHSAEGMREKFANASAQGFHHCQLTSWNPALWTDEKMEELKQLTAEYGVEITAFWCGWAGPKRWNFTEGPETLGIVPVAYRGMRVQNLLDGAAFADKLGIKDVVTHMGFIPENMTDPNYPGVVAAVKVIALDLKRREQNPGWDGSEEFNYFLSVIFPDDQLYIMDYNRIVKDLNGYTDARFLAAVGEKFDIEEFEGAGVLKPSAKHTYGMYLDGKWYLLTAREGSFDEGDPVARLDVSILQNNLLSPILGIGDPRTDKRIDFVGGIRGLQCLADRVDSGEMKVAFSMYPTTMDDLMDIADAGAIMPPKSTWFEPKLRSGVFIHKLK